ncbi:MAG TPA: hypothetical protein VNS09_07695 [Solirubrobacter sp.]|nr:hypothetical protein [Solirubrobacter sp.]
MSVVSVTGPVALSGVVESHGHSWIAPTGVRLSPVLDDFEGIAGDLTAFAVAGGVALVDCQPPDTGRDVERLVALSERSGVAIVAATGFHLRRYYAEPGIWAQDADAVEAFFTRELQEGPAGFVKAAVPADPEACDVPRLLGAAARAALATGAMLLIHTERGEGLDALRRLLDAAGLPPRQVMLSHVDKHPDHALHAELAAAGYLLGYDTFLRPKYDPDANVWPLIAAMLDAGHAERLALGLDLADRELWRFSGHPEGLLALPGSIAARLDAIGAPAAARDALLGGNVLRRLEGLDA